LQTLSIDPNAVQLRSTRSIQQLPQHDAGMKKHAATQQPSNNRLNVVRSKRMSFFTTEALQTDKPES
jgi:hypothetical protein